jgi:hypothetical protein
MTHLWKTFLTILCQLNLCLHHKQKKYFCNSKKGKLFFLYKAELFKKNTCVKLAFKMLYLAAHRISLLPKVSAK